MNWLEKRIAGSKAKTVRLANALDRVLDDMLGATDFGMPVEDPDHPFHDSVKEARAALTDFDGLKR